MNCVVSHNADGSHFASEQARTRSESGSYSNQAQEIVRRYVNSDDDKANVHERQLLEKIRKELDHARKKVDEAALALRDEKAALEVSHAWLWPLN